MTDYRHIVVMGVSASGKSTIGAELADRLGYSYAEGDDFHDDAARSAMAAGRPLTDEDREPWLMRIRDWIAEQDEAGHHTVITCSALKQWYRDLIREAASGVVFIHVHPPVDELRRRIANRSGHFMPPSLLDSQLDDLEPLSDDEGATFTALDKDETLDEAEEWITGGV